MEYVLTIFFTNYFLHISRGKIHTFAQSLFHVLSFSLNKTFKTEKKKIYLHLSTSYKN